MRVVFLGSPEVVLGPLTQLHNDTPGHKLVGVVSQPARPFGRGGKVKNPAVAEYALTHGIPLLQPDSAKSPEFQQALREWEPDVCVTAAYGQILDNSFLGIPKRATINIHPSMLPRYRGASPVQSALYCGEKTTGVTILFTVRALDAGAIIVQREYPIAPNETSTELMPRMFEAGAQLLPEALGLLENHEFRGTPQNEALVTHCKKFSKDDGEIAWDRDAQFIHNCFRAFQPWPGVFSNIKDKRVVITNLSVAEQSAQQLKPGEFTFDKAEQALLCGTGDGTLAIRGIKPAGGKEQNAAAFWNGVKGKLDYYQFGEQK